MTQEEFIRLSKKEVKWLNGRQEDQDVTTAWRSGYLYFRDLVKDSLHNDPYFIDRMEHLVEDDFLDEFED